MKQTIKTFKKWNKESVELDEAKSRKIISGLGDADGPFSIVALKGKKVVAQDDTKYHKLLPAIVKELLKHVPGATIAIENKNGKVVKTFKESVELEESDDQRRKSLVGMINRVAGAARKSGEERRKKRGKDSSDHVPGKIKFGKREESVELDEEHMMGKTVIVAGKKGKVTEFLGSEYGTEKYKVKLEDGSVITASSIEMEIA